MDDGIARLIGPNFTILDIQEQTWDRGLVLHVLEQQHNLGMELISVYTVDDREFYFPTQRFIFKKNNNLDDGK